MTNEEAKSVLKVLASFQGVMEYLEQHSVSVQDACNMAIQALSQEPCGESINKTYEFGKNKGVAVYWNKQTDTVELPEAVFRYILSLVPTDKEIEA